MNFYFYLNFLIIKKNSKFKNSNIKLFNNQLKEDLILEQNMNEAKNYLNYNKKNNNNLFK